jgi:putative intracellular protease/amidase
MSKGKVLIVMSSANTLDLKDGKTYSTGYDLNEFVVPYRNLVEAGYEPVIANPKGDHPAMDVNSNNAMFFGGDDAARADALNFAESLAALDHPKTLAYHGNRKNRGTPRALCSHFLRLRCGRSTLDGSVVADDTQGYAGLFIPGGHAPMADLLKDKNLGKMVAKGWHILPPGG